MAEHELKCWFKPYDAIADGSKRFEWRKNDRNFAVGDTLVLRRYDPHNGEGYTGESQRVRVTYMLAGPAYGIPEGYCIMSIEKEARRGWVWARHGPCATSWRSSPTRLTSCCETRTTTATGGNRSTTRGMLLAGCWRSSPPARMQTERKTPMTFLTHANLVEELGNVVRNAPLFPGNTVSHAGAAELQHLGLIARAADGSGDWVPTEDGRRAHASGSIQA